MYDRITNSNARNAAQASDLYERLYCEEEDRQRAEWEGEFGAANPRFPFKPSGIHAVVARRIERIKHMRYDD